MNEYVLTSRSYASLAVSRHFERSKSAGSILSVREDKCFGDDGWLDLGEIRLKPGTCEPGEEIGDKFREAVDLGFFEWSCSRTEDLVAKASELMRLGEEQNREKKQERGDKTVRALDAIACVAARIGLIHPMFDAGALSEMPFRRPTTVVADTSAVLQGGLDFVVRFLYPLARIKVPAIAHMEVLTAADNYLRLRRAANLKDKAKTLLEHVRSQGGQRALLRLELQTDAEIERSRLGADPLRGVVYHDSDVEDKNLGLQATQRSFADRLIFETARQHLSQSSPDHPVILMTADQGLARMTLGEGMQPLFFEATRLSAVSGRRLSGTNFNPFDGTVYPLCLTNLLWEFAVTFGMARLKSSDDNSVEVCAIGDELSWQPYHATDDLLWLRTTSGPEKEAMKSPDTAMSSEQRKSGGTPPPEPRAKSRKGVTVSSDEATGPRAYAGSYKFSLPKMVVLINRLAQSGRMTFREAMAVLEIKSPVQLEDYRNFLLAGTFIEMVDSGIQCTQLLRDLDTTLKKLDLDAATTLFRRVQSFSGYVDFLSSDRNDNPAAQRALSTYQALAEMLGMCFEVPDERVYGTFKHPTPAAFAELALDSYDRLAGATQRYVMTGLWLEDLVRESGIHPLTSRTLLEEARMMELIERYTEGSTPETRFQNHTLHVLEIRNGQPTVRKLGIFEGDFLIPGKSSVSIRLKRGQA